MKALTLHQPWASLVALGAKTIETRSWATKYRGPLAVHAGARQVHSGNFLLLARTARMRGLITSEQEHDFRSLDVPFGAVVATCTLADVVATYGQRTAEDLGRPGDLPYGDFAPSRFAWLLADIEPVDPSVPAKGKQGLWEWEP